MSENLKKIKSPHSDWVKKRGIHYFQVPSNYLEATSHDGSTSPLHDAAKRGNMELLRECLLNKMPVNQGDAAGEWN